MPDIHIADMADEVIEALMQRAGNNGRSLNDEAIAILTAAVTQSPKPITTDKQNEA